jgi:hypothetical protein
MPLDPILKQAVTAGTPVEIFDRVMKAMHYIVSAEQFRKLPPANDFNPADAYPIIDRLMAEDDAHDPLVDSYQ